MGMFDWYEPQPPLPCPKCGSALTGWQGKSGPCGLFEWIQGRRSPSRQLVDEDIAISEAQRDKLVLPEEFELHTDCGTCGTWVEAHGWCDAGIWTRVNLDPVSP